MESESPVRKPFRKKEKTLYRIIHFLFRSKSKVSRVERKTKTFPIRLEPNLQEEIGNLSTWMTNLPEDIRSLPLYKLAIPGSHDSFSYAIDSKSEFSPDFDLYKNKQFIAPFKWKIQQWAKTQDASLIDQLENGIRYLDLRVCMTQRNEADVAVLCHGLFANPLFDEMNNVKSFLLKHPDEVVLLDINHIYEFNDKQLSDMVNSITEIFGSMIYKFNKEDTVMPSIAEIRAKKAQVILFLPLGETPIFRNHRSWIDSRWLRTSNSNVLMKRLNEVYENSKESKRLTVYQGIFSAETMDYITSEDLKTLTTIAHKKIRIWLEDLYEAKTNHINIFITDFCVYGYPTYSRDVIRLNFGNRKL